MKLVELWTDAPERPPLRLDPHVISLAPIQRQRADAARQAAYDDGTVIGFFLGVAAAVLCWAILSGLLLRVTIAIVHGVLALLYGRP